MSAIAGLRVVATTALLVLAACGSATSDGATGSRTGTDAGGGSDPDAGSTVTPPSQTDAGDAGSGNAPSRCTVDPSGITCEHDITTLSGRNVAYAIPAGTAPAAGWPTVIYFQGSFVAGDAAFAAVPTAQFGMYQLTLTIKTLLDRGYAVVAPNASGGAAWESNVPPFAQSWSGCADDVFMKALFAEMTSGTFGTLDAAHLYAMGISSGGFMTSRMAVSYAGKFRALADHSGSYATCSTFCTVPSPLPSDHPPVLFLRGEQDTLVPSSSVKPYLDGLLAEGHEAKLVTDPKSGHEWLAVGATAIPDWFDAHR